MTTKARIKAWFDIAEANGSTHMIVVDDTYDHEDYPVYVPKEIDIHEAIKRYDDVGMQRIMEVYRISMGWEAQSDGRAYNI